MPGLWPERQLLYQPATPWGGCSDKVLRSVVLVPFCCCNCQMAHSDSGSRNLTAFMKMFRFMKIAHGSESI